MERAWKCPGPDSGAVHAIGNGKILAYGRGPELMQVIGPPYSAPSWARACFTDPDLASVSVREARTAVWRHELTRGGRRIGELTDFTAGSLPCLIRRVRLFEPLGMTFSFHENAIVVDNARRLAGAERPVAAAALVRLEAGTFLYGRYPIPAPTHHQFAVTGNARALPGPPENGAAVLFEPGESFAYWVGGPSYPECAEHTLAALSRAGEEFLLETRRAWNGYARERMACESGIPPSVPRREALLEAVDSADTLMRAQQDAGGGVLAGHNYHLCYVRDQYGVSRCLLRLGHAGGAEAILRYYHRVWTRHGLLHNAQAAGVDGVFHAHENDAVEITGYLIIQAFDFLRATGNGGMIREIAPMLEWAWEAQKGQLANRMLPFNGDETYIAGGLLPRSVLHHGSAEATLLFVEAGRRLLPWIARHGLWSGSRLDENLRIWSDVRDHFKANFMDAGGMFANNPARMPAGDWPAYRHGVCEACSAFGWTAKNPNGRYLCPACLQRKGLEAAPQVRYRIPSVSLLPAYIGSDVAGAEAAGKTITQLSDGFGRADSPLPARQSLRVGCDDGLTLYSLTETGHPLAPALYGKTLDSLDETGAWAEYYRDGAPGGTRCRPWESGVNLHALLHFAASWEESARSGRNDHR